MMVVAIVAILFVGPKELPAMLRTFGRTVKKVRAMASEFQGQFDEALKEAELDGVKDSINKVRDLDPTKKIKDSLNPLKADLEKTGNEIKQSTEFDPKNFSEDYGSDVEAELDQQDAAAAAEKALPPSSGKNAVPGFSSVPDPVEAPVKTKPAAKKASAKKTSAKKPATKKTAVKKPTAKTATTKTAAAKKPAAKTAAKSKAKPRTAKAKAPAKKANA